MTTTALNQIPDEKLLELFATTKEQQYFEEIHRRHHREMKDFLTKRYLNGDENLAEDVSQQAFINLCEKHSLYDPKYSFRAWLFSIAANAAIDVKRHRGRRPALSISNKVAGHWQGKDHDSGASSDYDPKDQRGQESRDMAIMRETHEGLHAALLGLSDVDRAAVHAVYFEDQSFTDAAAGLGIPVGTLKTRINRALGQIRGRAPELKTEVA
jgi:RNA polymerase sigma-70 factor (ECF subfamily)